MNYLACKTIFKFFFMKKLLAILLMVAALACGNDPETDSNPTLAADTSVAASQQTDSLFDGNFYPFPQYIMGQLEYVDTMPLAVAMIKTVNGKTVDSGYVDKKLFREAVLPFLQEDPNLAEWKNGFKESSFEDLSLNAITFTISATQPNSSLRQADVLLNPLTKKVKTVNIRKIRNNGDSSIFQNLLWTHNYRSQLVEDITLKNGTHQQMITQFIWDIPPANSVID